MQLRYLLLRLGILTSGNVKNNIGESHTTKHGRTITTRRLAYNLRIPKHPNLSSIIEYKRDGQYFKYFEWNNTLWGRVKNICKSVYSGDVYDFNMIDNHNYLTDMGLVSQFGEARRKFCYLPRALACGYRQFSRDEEESRRRRDEGARLVLRSLDT